MFLCNRDRKVMLKIVMMIYTLIILDIQAETNAFCLMTYQCFDELNILTEYNWYSPMHGYLLWTVFLCRRRLCAVRQYFHLNNFTI